VGDYALVEVRKLPSGIVAQRILPLSLPLKVGKNHCRQLTSQPSRRVPSLNRRPYFPAQDRDLLDVRRHWGALRRQRLCV
jgi:hypothetical protein